MADTYEGRLGQAADDSVDVAKDVVGALLEEAEAPKFNQYAFMALSARSSPPTTRKLSNVIRVSFPAEIPKGLADRYKKVKQDIDKWHSWVEGKAGKLINDKMEKKELRGDALLNYGAKVFDTILRNHSPWIPVTCRDKQELKATENKFDLHKTILKTILSDIVSEPKLLDKLEEVFQAITKALSFNTTEANAKRSIWIMLEYYIYDAAVDDIRTVIRTISFDVGTEAKEYTSNKAQYKKVKLQLDYYQTDAKFVQEIWEMAKEKINASINEAIDRVITEELDIPVD